MTYALAAPAGSSRNAYKPKCMDRRATAVRSSGAPGIAPEIPVLLEITLAPRRVVRDFEGYCLRPYRPVRILHREQGATHLSASSEGGGCHPGSGD